MRRTAVLLVLLGALAALVTTSASGAGRTSPTRLTIWVGFTGPSLQAFKKVVGEFDRSNPELTVNVVGAINDDKIVAAIRSGTAPDVVSSFNSWNVGNYCGTGAWLDLAPYLKQSHVNLSIFPPITMYYTQYGGKRCALPMLADTMGLYYNTQLFAKAGISGPPKTMSELFADAKKLTVRNADGSIKVAGFDPLVGFYENYPQNWISFFGGKWVDAKGHAILAENPAWTKYATFLKKLVDWYGYDNLVRFQAGLGDEFSASNAFETGKLAMNLDGEWRVSFIASDHSKVPYNTAPMPVDDGQPSLYGSGPVNGTIIGIPRGAKHPDLSWKLVEYLTTNTRALAQMANGLGNVPTTKASLTSKYLIPNKRFATFLRISGHAKDSTSPITASGSAFTNSVQNFFTQWQAGKVGNLAAGLRKLDSQLDAQVAQAKGGAGVP